MSEQNYKDYLGDGLYVDFDGYAIRLYASNGIHTLSEVFLEPQVLESFFRYIERLKQIKKDKEVINDLR